jgi:hypothetical protein
MIAFIRDCLEELGVQSELFYNPEHTKGNLFATEVALCFPVKPMWYRSTGRRGRESHFTPQKQTGGCTVVTPPT